ncbi:MAG: hypothetical protein H0T54_01760 [Geodermatophilaceae bacterium]|nr:hypothetical protein [Geodermatophilaceae bacterium]
MTRLLLDQMYPITLAASLRAEGFDVLAVPASSWPVLIGGRDGAGVSRLHAALSAHLLSLPVSGQAVEWL